MAIVVVVVGVAGRRSFLKERPHERGHSNHRFAKSNQGSRGTSPSTSASKGWAAEEQESDVVVVGSIHNAKNADHTCTCQQLTLGQDTICTQSVPSFDVNDAFEQCSESGSAFLVYWTPTAVAINGASIKQCIAPLPPTDESDKSEDRCHIHCPPAGGRRRVQIIIGLTTASDTETTSPPAVLQSATLTTSLANRAAHLVYLPPSIAASSTSRVYWYFFQAPIVAFLPLTIRVARSIPHYLFLVKCHGTVNRRATTIFALSSKEVSIKQYLARCIPRTGSARASSGGLDEELRRARHECIGITRVVPHPAPAHPAPATTRVVHGWQVWGWRGKYLVQVLA
ncbi:hypothetical protein BDZ89DRAFT_1052179 [Hymenopellis radicata]|nr:hypothetical protein BDZ89DRAFT_1052179 [Hymenopellis radicata]